MPSRPEEIVIRLQARIRRLPLIATVVLALSACNQSPDVERLQKSSEVERLQSQVDELKHELSAVTADRNALKARVEELSITPSVLLANVVSAVDAGKVDDAEKALNTLRAKFPLAPEAKKAQELVDSLKAKAEKQQAEVRRLEAMGFKALVASSQVDTNDVKVKVGTPTFTRQFVFDRYDNSYHYHDADRDYKYVVVSLSATAAKGIGDPDLPGFALYWADGKELRQISEFSLQFARWEDYATYLGNYSDSSNDFAKSATIPFSMGAHGSDDVLSKRPLYIVATAKGCQRRNFERFRNPPIYYSGMCEGLAPTLRLDAFAKENGNLILVRRID